MNTSTKVLIVIEIILVLIFLNFLTSEPKTKPGMFEIGEDEERYRFQVEVHHKEGSYTYTSENMSWNDMITNGFVKDEELHMNRDFWEQALIERGVIYYRPYAFCEIVWEAYY
jgi:hypothetical protein